MDLILKLTFVVLLIALNGFFVAAEFAIIRARQTRVMELVEQGNKEAVTVHKFLSQLDTYLSATQLGVTLASLAIGALGEPTLAAALSKPLSLIGISATSSHGVAIAILVGFIIITFLHVIFGELLPKWWVIAHSESTVLAVALPMRIAIFLGTPLIKPIEYFATIIARLIKIEPGVAHMQAHSEDEILAIMAHAHKEGELRPSEIEIAENVFDFAHTQAKEIMVPRVDIIYLSTTWTLQENVDVAVDSGYTRYPVCEGDKDHIIGMIHIKDLLAISGDPQGDLRSITRPIINIPETKPIDELLKELQKSHSHQAVVLDEYGGTSGLVTLEDIIEELIVEIQDEHDKPPSFEVVDEDKDIYNFAGTISIDDVADKLEIEIANPSEYETIGGYALYELHIAPRLAATAQLDGYDVSVIEVTGRRIKRLRFTKRVEEPVSKTSEKAEASTKEAAE